MTMTAVLLGVLAVTMAVAVWRMSAGPTDADRVVAVDLAFVVFVAAVALLAVRLDAPAVLILVLAATLLGFLTTVAVAHLLERWSS
ncbi:MULTISPECIES: monovalent cation/H+ antiporter complex subunit F [Streptomyces]|jgi:multicomponent Na+:H+ antiporter subunit F|uniref:Multicomponent Na+:H+ antiporter subunit F n=1 Tax=Streptomyces radiopugnans TaxID=403935 RepID=A0A1H9F474_9ACTN|nr:monovalent cation/H+ antiporter complex subunit F [Streptomyces radiopugnans]SEQ32687.1 multicomponent Na+:H+ antiporter subunit F [Streptomyces radiopugnans]